MKITITNQQMLNFRVHALNYLKARENKLSRFLLAVKDAVDLTEEAYKDYTRTKRDGEIEFYGKDDKGYIIVDPNGNMKITPENQKELNKKIDDLNDKTIDLEVKQFELNELPDGITIMNYDFFSPILLPEMSNELINKLLGEESDGQKV